MHDPVSSLAISACVSLAHCLSMAAQQIYVGVTDDENQVYAQTWGVRLEAARYWYDWVKSNTHYSQGVFFPCKYLDNLAGVMLCLSTAKSSNKSKENGISCS